MQTPRWPAGAAVVTVLAAAGCGAETPDVDDSGAVGPDEAASEMIDVLQVQLAYPLDGVYEEGEDASLYFGIANDGTLEDDLLDVRGPDFTDAALTVDGRAAVIPVAPNDNVYVGAEGSPSVVLEDLQTTLRSSQSIPVTFVFEEAGEVTVDAMVAAEGQDPTPPFDFPDPAEDPTS
ncbi:copper chaperone PCu(A)C [Geodermatophilus normandii]|uniref:Copper chaperone PCu(A)C n=1 Tax=Geodermatophilus normandii TaxID=1137989 RepID=A0A6P0GLQ5_9ACTN|nr:copper chaperone PCu(A)C [Geodermatophilus normandii]NEM08267.1 copper chaperone PCu(A)C [Geodermatophilus normandii]